MTTIDEMTEFMQTMKIADAYKQAADLHNKNGKSLKDVAMEVKATDPRMFLILIAQASAEYSKAAEFLDLATGFLIQAQLKGVLDK